MQSALTFRGQNIADDLLKGNNYDDLSTDETIIDYAMTEQIIRVGSMAW